MITFGEFTKDLRLNNQLTLREFCRITKLDPSNWSKIERGVFQPPKSKVILNEIAKVLNLEKGTEDWYTLMDLAAINYIPKDLIDDKSILDKLPIFFRTVRGQKPTEEELEELIRLIKGELNCQ